jgi:hypothetical protein
MRVFVQNSIEAKAVLEYMTLHPNQKPAALVPHAILVKIVSTAARISSARMCAAHFLTSGTHFSQVCDAGRHLGNGCCVF